MAYLLIHATMLRRRDAAPGAAQRVEEHAHALELLADLMRALPEDDERQLLLGSLVVRGGQLAPGPANEHALTKFAGTSREASDAFLTSLVQIARDRVMMPSHERALMAICRPDVRTDEPSERARNEGDGTHATTRPMALHNAAT